MEMAREDEAAVYFMIDTPQFFMDTPDSSENVREGGLASTIIETVSLESNMNILSLTSSSSDLF